MINPFDLTGKIILITGASSGIGKQCAISCSEMGANLILLGRSTKRLNETLSLTKNPENHYIFSVDLTEFNTVKDLSEEIKVKNGSIDGIIHSAGISTTFPLKLLTEEKTNLFFQTNVSSALNLTKEFCKIGRFSKDGGSIVFLSSIMGVVGENGKFLYSMTKGALIAAARSLACELAKKKIRVNCISPGVIITPINESQPHITDEEKKILLESKHLLGLGSTTDIANACIYLLSDAAKWVTGINLLVDGGYTCR